MVRKCICKQCGKEFETKYKGLFCSRSCAATYNNLHRKPRSMESKKKTSDSLKRYHHNENNEQEFLDDQTCENCGCKIYSLNKRRFCSLKCMGEYTKSHKLNEWKTEPEKFNNIHYSFIKNYLMKLHNYKCELCGWGETNIFTKKIPLEIHHIDGNCTNNKIENLQLLCPNCHSLTENYGSRNKGKSKRKYKN